MTAEERLASLTWRLAEPGDTAAPRRTARAQPRDFVLDLTLDLEPLHDPAAAVAATTALAERLAEAFPERPVTIKRQALDILPHQSFVGGVGDAPSASEGARSLSADLQVGLAER